MCTCVGSERCCRILTIEFFSVRGRTYMVSWEEVDGFGFNIEND